jgi:dCMP deaminase
MIINAGIKKIYYQSGYTDALAQEMLTEAGIDLIKHDDLSNQGGPP